MTRGLAMRQVEARFLNEELRDHGGLDPDVERTVDSDHAALVASFA